MGHAPAAQLATWTSDGLSIRARRGYYAAMTEREKLESNLQRRITHREWSTLRTRAFELFA